MRKTATDLRQPEEAIEMIGKVRDIIVDIIYVLGFVIGAIVLVPPALLLSAVIEIKKALGRGQVTRGDVEPAYYGVGLCSENWLPGQCAHACNDRHKVTPES